MLRGVLILLRMTPVPRLVMRLLLDPRVPLRVKLILPAAVIYLISPFDLLHDMVPVLGRIDDVLVLVIALASFLAMAPREVVSEHLGRPRGQKPDQDRTVIEGDYRVVDDEGEETSR